MCARMRAYASRKQQSNTQQKQKPDLRFRWDGSPQDWWISPSILMGSKPSPGSWLPGGWDPTVTQERVTASRGCLRFAVQHAAFDDSTERYQLQQLGRVWVRELVESMGCPVLFLEDSDLEGAKRWAELGS